MMDRIADGRTDLVFDHISPGHPDTERALGWCAYYGDVSGIRYLLSTGAPLAWLGENLASTAPLSTATGGSANSSSSAAPTPTTRFQTPARCRSTPPSAPPGAPRTTW
jgi:hypothetical protein